MIFQGLTAHFFPALNTIPLSGWTPIYLSLFCGRMTARHEHPNASGFPLGCSGRTHWPWGKWLTGSHVPGSTWKPSTVPPRHPVTDAEMNTAPENTASWPGGCPDDDGPGPRASNPGFLSLCSPRLGLHPAGQAPVPSHRMAPRVGATSPGRPLRPEILLNRGWSVQTHIRF